MIVLRPDRAEPWPQRGNDATIHACRAVVAARLRWPDREVAFLRRLQMLAAAGQMLDDSDTLELAAEQAGLPVAEIAAFCAEPEVEAALREDMALAAGRRCGDIAPKN
jgi:predicted DsbA family dithiol-disulfide isomerase